MPKRFNLHQAVVYYVKQHLAPENVTVTESAMLTDADSGEQREVDIVIEGSLGDDPVVVSVEVTAKQRRADLTWIDAMLGKHARMPTNRLVLVSWSGFTGSALRKVEEQGGRVVALTPLAVPNAHVPELFYEELSSTPETATMLVRQTDGTLARVFDVPILANLYAAPDHDALICSLRDLVLRVLNEGAGRELSRQAHEHDDSDSLTHFSLEVDDVESLGLHIHDRESGFHPLVGYLVTGPVSQHRQPVEFSVMQLGGSLFAMSEVRMAGRQAVWVLTPRDDHTATVSWRLV